MKIRNFFNRVKAYLTADTKTKNQTAPAANGTQIRQVIQNVKIERFFYRNAGLNRQEKNRLRGEISRATGQKRKLLQKILDGSPRNVPYVRGQKIPLQHVGIATPEKLYLTA